jgi:CRISPR type IV-associated protein Csf2
MKNSIDIILRTTSPWHVAYPGNVSKEKDNISQTQTKKVNGKSVPCFLGNGLRGRIRREIAKRITDVILEVQGPITADVYIGLQTGSSSAQPDKTHKSVEELVRSKKHVYMGLLGGGSRTLPSRYKITDINPIIEQTVNAGMFNLPGEILTPILDQSAYKKDDVVKYLQPYQMLEARSFFKVDDIKRGFNLSKILNAVEDGETGIATYIEKSSTSDKARKDDESGDTKKTTVGNMLSIECIATGAMMHFRVDLAPDITSAQAGAMLLALKGIFDTNYFGGWGRIGFGQYEVLSMSVILNTFDVQQVLEDDLYENEEFSYANASNEIKQLIADAEQEIASVSKEEIISYFTNLA